MTWTGFIQTEILEPYFFEAEADDGLRLWIDDELVLDNWASSGPQAEQPSGSIRLDPNRRYPIRVEYEEGIQNASARLYWRSRGAEERTVVPQARLFTDMALEEGDGLTGLYRSEERYLAYTQRAGDLYAIFFQWPDGELALPIPAPTSGTRFELLGMEGDLSWRSEDGVVYVDLSTIPFREIPGLWAWTIRVNDYVDGGE